jgi:zinc protease
MRSASALLGLLAVLAVEAPLAAQTPMPTPSAPRTFQFPAHSKKVLPNGLTVFVVEDHRLPLVSFSLQILSGGALNPPEKSGVASMTASLLREGTATRTSQQISKLVDSTGGSLGASANDDTTSINGSFMKSYADAGMELLADIAINPKFAQEEIDRALRQNQSGLAVQYNSSEYLAPLLAARGILGVHPYAYPGDGTPETLRNISRDDLVGFHKTHYAPGRAFLAIAGDVTPEEAFAKAEKYLGAWKTPAPAEVKLPAPPAPAARVLALDKPGNNQTQIVMGHVGVARNHPDYVALTVANQVFGGSFNSRLNMKLRANEGLTYGASSSFSPQRQAGLFTLSTFTRTEKTVEAIQFMADLLKEWKQNPATEPEFQEARNYLLGAFGLSLETSGAVAQRVVNTAIFGLPEDYWSGYQKQLQSLTREQMAAAVQRFLQPEKMTIATVGDSKAYAKPLEKFGPVQVIPDGELDLLAENLMRKKVAVTATAEGAASARALVDGAVAAMGGKEKLLAIRDLTTKASMKITAPQGSLDASSDEFVVYPDKYRLVLTLGAMGQIVQATDGTAAFMIQGPNTRDLPPQMAAEMKKAVPTAAGLGLLTAVLNGSAQVLPIDASTLQWKMGEFEVKMTFDPATKLLTKIGYRAMGMMGPAESEVAFADYQSVDGVQLPARETILQNGQKFAERTVTERKVNAGVDAASFKKP